ncbi:DUF2442 domain-containing protein [Mesorhizobium composti]|uniref:DUF2442 domain-containing protein n=2 Tax=Ollibium composti TaxID=2675109 RepID=A0ABY2Q4Y4_9HYPH|nr:DUF2442 domain-containing protein [Mesorhizobium composti]THF55985.1 DUF2442 domain-containing protein [Mesorhizobium composti]
MSGARNAQANPAAEIEAEIRPDLPWRVASVAPMSDYRLKVRFIDGLEGEVHMSPLLTSPKAGVFASLRDEAVFDEVHLRWGAVTWPGNLDLAPDAMYDDIKESGVSVVVPYED